MSEVKPNEIIQQVSEAIPVECKDNIVIIGSLAAAYAYFGKNDKMAVQTKDIDCLIEPFHLAPEKGQKITRQLLDKGWHRRKIGNYKEPGTPLTPDDELPAVRLYPPEINPESKEAWFIELLTVPESSENQGKNWLRIVVDEGHFGLPSFRFLSITAFRPEKTDQFGIHYARPEMMALANLLEHSEIGPEIMSTQFGGHEIKRSNKDLGRVLAIGYLAQENGLSDFSYWGDEWKVALQECFKDEWKHLASNAGNGFRELLNSEDDLRQSYITCMYGLLSSFTITQEELLEVGNRVLVEAVEYLENLSK